MTAKLRNHQIGFIIDSSKVAYLRMFKAASSSILTALRTAGHIRADYPGEDYYLRRSIIADWHKHYPDRCRYRLATFVRHPLDRYVSGMRYLVWRREHHPRRSDHCLPMGTVLEEAIRVGVGIDKRILRRHASEPQARMLAPHGGHAFEFIGKFENLEEDFSRFCEWAGIPQLELPHSHKVGPRLRWQDHIPSDMLDELVDHFAEDFDTYDYARP